MLLPATYNKVSSAYLMMREFPRISTISFTKISNNNGYKMDPCGTLQITKSDLGKVY